MDEQLKNRCLAAVRTGEYLAKFPDDIDDGNDRLVLDRHLLFKELEATQIKLDDARAEHVSMVVGYEKLERERDVLRSRLDKALALLDDCHDMMAASRSGYLATSANDLHKQIQRLRRSSAPAVERRGPITRCPDCSPEDEWHEVECVLDSAGLSSSARLKAVLTIKRSDHDTQWDRGWNAAVEEVYRLGAPHLCDPEGNPPPSIVEEDQGREHDLKTWPKAFEALRSGVKTFEVRVNDRDFRVGDTLHLREWSPESESYSGQSIRRRVTYLMHGRFGLPDNICVMAVVPARDSEDRSPTRDASSNRMVWDGMTWRCEEPGDADRAARDLSGQCSYPDCDCETLCDTIRVQTRQRP